MTVVTAERKRNDFNTNEKKIITVQIVPEIKNKK